MATNVANLKMARTLFHSSAGGYYMLDNAAIIMPAISDLVATSLFRIALVLDRPVNLPVLQRALSNIAPRFPYFMVELRPGFFWYYFQPSRRPPAVIADLGSPCQGLNPRRAKGHLFRVRARGSRIACEFSHILADGYGGLIFAKTLLAEYFRLQGVVSEPAPDVFLPGTEPNPHEWEDAYHRYFRENWPHPDPRPRAFRPPSPALPLGQYRILTGVFDLAAVRQAAQSRGATVTELLTAALIFAYQGIWESLPPRARRRRECMAAVEIPVNMRRFYPSRTLRNFTLFILPAVDLRLGPYTFEELVRIVHHRVALENEEREIARQISRNAGGGRKLMVRLVPLFLKNFFARLLYDSLGEGLITGLLTNLGPMTLPSPLDERVRRFEFIPAPSRSLKTNAAVCSWKGELHVTFASRARSREVERRFFSVLSSINLRARIECESDEQAAPFREANPLSGGPR